MGVELEARNVVQVKEEVVVKVGIKVGVVVKEEVEMEIMRKCCVM